MEVNLINISLITLFLLSLVMVFVFFKVKRSSAQDSKFLVNRLHFATTLDLSIEIILYLILLYCIQSNNELKYLLIGTLLIITFKGFKDE
tara:strand:- start:199885 stop:200154 length:270 start_codon:yes stop_codon:yes gene_type:complete